MASDLPIVGIGASAGGIDNRHDRCSAKDLSQHALAVGRQMGDDDKRQTIICQHGFKKRLERRGSSFCYKSGRPRCRCSRGFNREPIGGCVRSRAGRYEIRRQRKVSPARNGTTAVSPPPAYSGIVDNSRRRVMRVSLGGSR